MFTFIIRFSFQNFHIAVAANMLPDTRQDV
jgi:hypothetical protein